MRIKFSYNDLSEDNHLVRRLFPDNRCPRFIHQAKRSYPSRYGELGLYKKKRKDVKWISRFSLCNDRPPHGDAELAVDSGRWLAALAGDEQHEGVRPISRGQKDYRCDWTLLKPASACDFIRGCC